MAKSLPVWQTMEWAHLARKSHRQPDTPTILFAALRRWWGGQLRTFAAQGCPVTCELLTDQFCAVLAQHAPKLQALRLSSCYRITDVGLTTLARGSSLTHLELTCCGQAITANGLLTLASHAPGTLIELCVKYNASDAAKCCMMLLRDTAACCCCYSVILLRAAAAIACCCCYSVLLLLQSAAAA